LSPLKVSSIAFLTFFSANKLSNPRLILDIISIAYVVIPMAETKYLKGNTVIKIIREDKNVRYTTPSKIIKS